VPKHAVALIKLCDIQNEKTTINKDFIAKM